jgi:hypothetical protein
MHVNAIAYALYLVNPSMTGIDARLDSGGEEIAKKKISTYVGDAGKVSWLS